MQTDKREPIYLIFHSDMEKTTNTGVKFKSSQNTHLEDLSLNINLIKNYFTKNHLPVHDLSSDKDYQSEQNTLNKIKKFDKSKSILLITNNQNLFTDFYRPIIIINNESKNFDMTTCSEKEYYAFSYLFQIINDLKCGILGKATEDIKLLIDYFFNIYNKCFKINLQSLTSETTYKTKDVQEFLELVQEDVNLLIQEQIITSRLLVVIYRLSFFNLEAKVKAIGDFYRKELQIKSESYKFNYINHNTYGFYYQNLANKSFRGYKITIDIIDIKPPIPFSEEKIVIAKKLLKSKVKIKIVANALGFKEEELNDIVYGNNSTVTQNNNQQTTNTSPKQESLEEACKGINIEVAEEIKGIGIPSVDTSDRGS